MAKLLRRVSAAALALVVSACAGAAGPGLPSGAADAVSVQLIAFNDFHGNLEPPAGSNGRAGTVEVGGAEYFATHVARLRASNPHTVVVSAGDNIGASPLVSALFHDEPTIEALGAAGLDFSAAGNHEFDEGWRELLRMQRGGCHPVDGCRGSPAFAGASFRYRAANVRVDATGETLLPATATRTFDGVTVGFIGLALSDTPSFVMPSSVDGISFLPEAEAANAAARMLRAQGAAAVVVLIHDGGYLAPGDTDASCPSMTGDLVTVLAGMGPDIDVVVTGHTNRDYICRRDGKLVTSTASYSRFLTDIDLTIDRRTRRVVASTAVNVPVTRDVPRDSAQTAILERYRPAAASVGSRPVGTLSATLLKQYDDAGESALGDALSDAFLTMAGPADKGGAEIAITNYGGLRADLIHPDGADAKTPSSLTYGTVFTLMPFGNTLIVKTLTGSQLLRILEQQFDNPGAGLRTILQVSHNMRYSYDPTRPAGRRVNRDSVRIGGAPLDPDRAYRVAMVDFLWDGGDGFAYARAGTDAVGVGLDIDVFTAYLAAHSPFGPRPGGRITLER